MAQAKTASKELVNGDSEELVLLALNDKPIKKSSTEELKQALRYVMVLVGIRANNLPVDEEKLILLNHIQRYFGMYTIAEIRLAFELAIVGELDLKPDEVKCYENFSCEYVSRILKSYGKVHKKAVEFDEKRYKPAAAIPAPDDYTNAELVDLFYQDFLKGNYNPKIVSERVYDIAFKNCGLKLTEEQMLKIIGEAKEHVLNEYSVRLKRLSRSNEDISFYNLRDKKSELEKMSVGKACLNDDVNHYAKAMCLKLWFEEQKSKDIKRIINFL